MTGNHDETKYLCPKSALLFQQELCDQSSLVELLKLRQGELHQKGRTEAMTTHVLNSWCYEVGRLLDLDLLGDRCQSSLCHIGWPVAHAQSNQLHRAVATLSQMSLFWWKVAPYGNITLETFSHAKAVPMVGELGDHMLKKQNAQFRLTEEFSSSGELLNYAFGMPLASIWRASRIRKAVEELALSSRLMRGQNHTSAPCSISLLYFWRARSKSWPNLSNFWIMKFV